MKRRRMKRLRRGPVRLKIPRLTDRLRLLLGGMGVRMKPKKIRVQSLTLVERKTKNPKAR